ncbi:MAG: DnaB-like helicase C-terminal domain-containing protein [Chloroflexota bacterium]
MYDLEYQYQDGYHSDSYHSDGDHVEEPKLLINARVEQLMIGACLIDPDTPRNIVKEIPEFNWACFGLPTCQQLYMIIEDLDRRNEPINTFTLEDRGRELGIEVDSIYLSECIMNTPTGLYATHHAEIVYRDYQRRHLITEATKLVQKAFDDTVTVEELYTNAQGLLDGTSMKDGRKQIMGWRESFPFQHGLLDQYMNRPREDYLRFAWPWDSWNELIDPPRKGSFCWLSGPSGAGKTIIAEMIAETLAARGVHVLFAHLEINHELMVNRRLSRWVKITIREIEEGKYKNDNDKIDHILQAMQDYEALPGQIQYYHCPGKTATEIVSMARASGAEALIVDHLQLVKKNGAKGFNLETLEAMDAHTFKNFGEATGCRVYALDQMNKSAADIDPADLHIGHVRGSGQKNEAATETIMLYRKYCKNGQKFPNGEWSIRPGGRHNKTYIRVTKQRSGAQGTIIQRMSPQYHTLADAPELAAQEDV